MNVLAVIPARAGSKRLPGKNTMVLNGKPLIGYTIEAANKARAITDCVVSTDSGEIASIAESLGGKVPFIRPPALGGDNVRNGDVLLHALKMMKQLSGREYESVVLLQPTCPIRDYRHINDAVTLLVTNQHALSVASVKGPFVKRDPILKRVLASGLTENYCPRSVASEDQRAFYLYNASIYAVRATYLLDTGKFISDKEIALPMDDVHSIDIDTLLDFKIAEAVLAYRSSLRGIE